MSDKPYQWGHEHFCQPDATKLYHAEPGRINAIGYPVELDANPVPATFCSVCLEWFDDPQHLEGSEHRPPEQRETNG